MYPPHIFLYNELHCKMYILLLFAVLKSLKVTGLENLSTHSRQSVLSTLHHDTTLYCHNCSQILGVIQKRNWQLLPCPWWEYKSLSQAFHSLVRPFWSRAHHSPSFPSPTSSSQKFCLDISHCLMSHSPL